MKQSTKPNRDLEIALVKIARVLFEYLDSQFDLKEINRLDPIFDTFTQLVNDYHNQTGRLHPDLGQDFGEWGTLKNEWLEASLKKIKKSDGITAEWLQFYREGVVEMIEYSEREAGYEAKH